VDKDVLENPQFNEDNFNIIQFQRIIPFLVNKKQEKKIFCERMQNKGNILGYIFFTNNFMVFINSPNEEVFKSKDPNTQLDYLLSIREDSIVDENKYTLMLYKDIKEIFKRRICLNYIGYEIFMKDNKSYFFNFFNKQNMNSFMDEIRKNTFEKSKIVKANTVGEFFSEDLKKGEKNLSNSENEPVFMNLFEDTSNKEINFKVVDDPINKFEFKSRYRKGEMSNFNYLLLLNKYSSRTYNDYNQYLIFPLLFMDIERNRRRDLSKPVCLNKDDIKDILNSCKSNKELLGYSFNQHYSNSGYILYYLIRLIPFTYKSIEFQSGKFDLPTRLFSSLKNFLHFFIKSQDNRELCPEFFYNYEFLLNLNCNHFGLLETVNETYYLHNFDSNKNESFAEFIIYLRHLIERVDITPWIDNIFGYNQFNTSADNPNSFPLSSYESNFDYEKIKQESKSTETKLSEIEQKIDILKFGITPAKLFTSSHGKINKHSFNKYEDDINYFEKKEKKKILDIINEILKKKYKDKSYYLISNNNNNSNEIELIFKCQYKLNIYKIKSGDTKYIKNSFNLIDKLELYPSNNLFCEILPELYCIVRNRDNTIKFFSAKRLYGIYSYKCIITAVEPLPTKKNLEEKIIRKKIILGDERGYLKIVEVEFDVNLNEKTFDIKSLIITNSVKAHRSLVKGIIFNERLNVIISWSDEGVISINNGYSLDFINIIDMGSNHEIIEIQISKYDLLYVSSYNKEEISNNYAINCFTLNGIKVTSFESSEKIIKFFVNENVVIVQKNGNIFSYNSYDLYNLVNNAYSEYIEDNQENQNSRINIKECFYWPKVNRLLMIYSDNKVSFQNLGDNFI
jgi:hypothetical protein